MQAPPAPMGRRPVAMPPMSLCLPPVVTPAIAPEQVTSELQDVTCHMRSHGVTCHQTQVNTPRLNPGQTGWNCIRFTYRGGMEG